MQEGVGVGNGPFTFFPFQYRGEGWASVVFIGSISFWRVEVPKIVINLSWTENMKRIGSAVNQILHYTQTTEKQRGR